MKTIYKYEIKAGLNTFTIPDGAKILTVQIQDAKPYIWVKQDTNRHLVTRKFFTVGTGWDMQKELEKIDNTLIYDEYIGTFQIVDFGNLVFHLFEVI